MMFRFDKVTMHPVFTIVFFIMVPTLALDNLQVAYRWKMLNFHYPTPGDRQEALQSGRFVPENNVPLGLEVYEDRLFVTIPRWKRGVAASVAYLNISEAEMDSPELYPYPNWESHKIDRDDDPPQIVSPFRIRADRCGRLWILDAGRTETLEITSRRLVKLRLLIYTLRTDQLLRSYTIPDSQVHPNDSIFVSIAVEDSDCHNSFAYLADIGHPALVVYSFQAQKSWMVKHPYFHIDPKAGELVAAGVKFNWSDGIFGLALSGPDTEGYSTLYFHPLTSFDEFSVSTRVLRDEALATNQTASYNEYKRLGSRGAKGQSGASFLDKDSNVLFFASVNLNAVVCWRTTTNYTKESHSRVYMNNETMVFPNDIKVDANHTLWVLSDRLPKFMYSQLNYSDYNFRILKGQVYDAIKDTACDSKMVVNKTIVQRIKAVIKKDINQSPSSGESLQYHSLSLLILLVAILLR